MSKTTIKEQGSTRKKTAIYVRFPFSKIVGGKETRIQKEVPQVRIVRKTSIRIELIVLSS